MDSPPDALAIADSGLLPVPAHSKLPQQRWHIAPVQPQLAEELGAKLDLPALLAQVLINRGIVTGENAREFLEPETQQLPSPILEFPDLALSLELLEGAIATGTRIAICGDYDADGMTSTALLLRALRFLGAQVDYAIPSRMSEGYGINERIVEEFYAEGIGVILTVDNGIAAYEPIARARELGLTVIVTDHHDIPERLPPANAILNPKLLPVTSPYRGVAGVGVAYVLAVCLAQSLGKTRDLTAPLLELFTLGTIADLAPLTGVNRRWVRRGLGLLANSRVVGVQALIQVAGLGDADKSLKPEDIGFRLGPRINAVGRISDPQVVIDLLTTEDVGTAIERAMQCEQINQTRRDLCTQIEQEAIAWCEAQQQSGQVDLKRDRVLLVIQPDWHHGVIGIVASRLVERYGVPVFIGTYEDDAQKVIRGSARGIPEFHVFEALQVCDDLLEKYGGHRAAGGFSFLSKHLRQVKARLVNFANRQLDLEHIRPLVTVDVQASLSEVSLDLYEAINRLHPCGIENADPVFWSANVQVQEQKPVGRQQDHLKLVVAQNDGPAIKAIAWRWGEYCPLPDRLDIAYRLRLNEWQGTCTVELELVGVRLPQGPFRSKSISKPSHSDIPSPPLSPSPASPLPSPASSPKPTAQPATRHVPTTILREPEPQLSAPPALSPASPLPSSWTHRAEFFYSKRRYTVAIATQASSKEVTIRNPEGQQLVALLPERQGFLCSPGEAARPIDLADAYYFNLLRAGLNALELRQKTRLLVEKDELLAEKDSHIATLNRQIDLLEAKLSQLSHDQKQQFQKLQAELEQQESEIQSQEAHIAQIQSQLPTIQAAIDPKALRKEVRQIVGDKVWYCLSQNSQKDFYAAFKHQALIAGEEGDATLADYSEAGLRLAFVVERELIQPFFADLYNFLLPQGTTELGGVALAPQGKYTLGMLPPLLADSWKTLKASALQQTAPRAKALYSTARSGALSGQEQALLTEFLARWEHPAAEWMQADGATAAAMVDQIAKLRNRAAHAEAALVEWQYWLLCGLVIGDSKNPGLFQKIYGVHA